MPALRIPSGRRIGIAVVRIGRHGGGLNRLTASHSRTRPKSVPVCLCLPCSRMAELQFPPLELRITLSCVGDAKAPAIPLRRWDRVRL